MGYTFKKTHEAKRYTSFREIINETAEKFGDKTAYQIRVSKDTYKYVSFKEFRERFYALCDILLDAGLRGKRIAVSGNNCMEWALSYYAAATVGVVVPLDKELLKQDVINFLEAADCKAVLADAKRMEHAADFNAACKYPFENLMAITEKCEYKHKEEIDSIEYPADEMHILIFTSGTTGSSKGVCLSQQNILANVKQTCDMVEIKDTDRTLSILPLHHTYECSLDQTLVFSRGVTICYCDGLTKVQKNMAEYSPSILVVVPALLKILDKRIAKSVQEGCPKLFRKTFDKYPFSVAMSKLPFFIRNAIKKKVSDTLGGNMRLFIVGAAELDPQIVKDFMSLGITTLQGYGLTECAPLLAGNNDFYFNADSTGVPIPGVEIKLDGANDEGVGEILAKGENIMLGYYNDEQATKSVFTEDGWFRTGDLAKMGPDGELYITGRCKNVIVTGNGKNIYPEELETRLEDHPEVSEVLVYGAKTPDGDTAVKAKILPNKDVVAERLGKDATDEQIEALIKEIVTQVNSEVPSYKRIFITVVLKEPLERTTTAKIKRYGSNVD